MMRFFHQTWLVFLAFGIVADTGRCATTDAAPIMEVRFWDSTQGRLNYEYELLRLALEKTADDYPAYDLKRHDEDFGSLRGRRALAEGHPINVYAAPARDKEGALEARIISIPIPILGGLMGYRQLIVREDWLQDMAEITSEDQLKPLTVGQGQSWPDVAIFRRNGYSVNDTGRYSNLFTMLEQRRFDYLSLGIIEARRELASHQPANSTLALVPDLYLYYPLPVVFHVSATAGPLAERLEEGLERALKDGSMEALFQSHFADELTAIHAESRRLFILEAPLPGLEWSPQSELPPVLRFRTTAQ